MSNMRSITNTASFTPSSKASTRSKSVIDIDEVELVQEVISSIYAEAKQRQFWLEIHDEEVRYSEMGLIILPVTTSEKLSTREETIMMLALEDVWNDQEPQPARRVHLTYAWNPEISIRSTPPPLVQNV